MAVERFQDLIAWQKARRLTSDICGITRSRPLASDFGLSGQMQRSATSTMANIAEGFDRNRPAEFKRYLEIAKASNAELLSHLYVALDAGYIGEEQFESLKGMNDEVGRLLGGLIRSLKAQPKAPARIVSGVAPRDSELGTRN